MYIKQQNSRFFTYFKKKKNSRCKLLFKRIVNRVNGFLVNRVV